MADPFLPAWRRVRALAALTPTLQEAGVAHGVDWADGAEAIRPQADLARAA